MWAPRPHYVADRNRWTLVGDAHRIGVMKAAETSGRYPYELWTVRPFSEPHAPVITLRHVHKGDPTYTAMSVILIPYLPIVVLLVVLTAAAVRRAGVVLPSTWLESVDRRRGFEPIMTPKVPAPRRDEIPDQSGEGG